MAIFADKMAEQFVDGKLGASTTILLMTPYGTSHYWNLFSSRGANNSGITSSTVQLALVLLIKMEVVGSSRTMALHKTTILGRLCTANQGITSVADTPLYLKVPMHNSI